MTKKVGITVLRKAIASLWTARHYSKSDEADLRQATYLLHDALSELVVMRKDANAWKVLQDLGRRRKEAQVKWETTMLLADYDKLTNLSQQVWDILDN